MSLILNFSRVVEAHSRRQQAEDLGIRLRLAAGLDRLLVDGQMNDPGEHHVVVLARHGCGQDDVWIGRRIGDEMFRSHEEQVLA